jgi:hypothetical protein
MPIQRKATGLLAILGVFAVPLAAGAQAPAPSGTAPSAQQARPPFRLGFGDMMNLAVQPRHLKLAQAGREKNWKLAEWLRAELDDTFTRLVRLYPTVDKRELAPMMTMVKQPMDELKQAIKTENAKDFTAAYEHLTQACNACHAVNEVPEIAIKVPADTPQFNDQDFAPQK